MEQDHAQSFRARLMAFFTQPRETQREQQTMQAERQTVDGVTRGNEDPDRQRGQGIHQPVRTSTTYEEITQMTEAWRAREHGPRQPLSDATLQSIAQRYVDGKPVRQEFSSQQWEVLHQYIERLEDTRQMPREDGPPTGSAEAARIQGQWEANLARQEARETRAESLTAQLASMQQRLEAQQRAQQPSRSRGQGMGF